MGSGLDLLDVNRCEQSSVQSFFVSWRARAFKLQTWGLFAGLTMELVPRLRLRRIL